MVCEPRVRCRFPVFDGPLTVRSPLLVVTVQAVSRAGRACGERACRWRVDRLRRQQDIRLTKVELGDNGVLVRLVVRFAVCTLVSAPISLGGRSPELQTLSGL